MVVCPNPLPTACSNGDRGHCETEKGECLLAALTSRGAEPETELLICTYVRTLFSVLPYGLGACGLNGSNTN